MALPRKVWVGTLEYPLRLVDRDHPALEGDADGITHFELPGRGIFIANDLGERELLETLYHEITHTVNHAARIEDGAEEENIADGHGKVWTQLWLDNPRLQRWLTSTLNAIRKDREAA